MSRLILIETSTALCSTALAVDGKVVSYRSSDAPRAHASKCAAFIAEMLSETGCKVSDCDAVCVSAGPGSYTGLRVGVSTAKGLCFAGNVPLIAVGTLDVLVQQAFEDGLVPRNCARIVPMIDARRMEVYSAVYDAEGRRLTEVSPKVVAEGDYPSELSEGPVLFVGDGAQKCESVLACGNARFAQVYPKASAMTKPALRELEAGNFQDIAYFEPFYLKQFVATVSKKNPFLSI